MHALDTPVTTGYLAKPNRHPALLAVAVALHIGAVGAILSTKARLIDLPPEAIPLIRIAPPLPPPPRPADVPKAAPKTDLRAQIDRPPTSIPLQPMGQAWPQFEPSQPAGPAPTQAMVEPAPPIAQPVVLGAAIDPRFARDLQPPYPTALERMEIEGSVTVRIQVGTDGRVSAVELVRADDPAFFTTTRDWALKRWRFTAATRDGVAVATWLTKTVQFRIMR